MSGRQTEIKSSGGGSTAVTSPVVTDPLSFTGVVTFNNAANTPLTAADGVIDSTLTAGRVVIAGASGRLADDADLTFATDTLSVTKVNVKGGSGAGTLTVGGVLGKGAPAQATTGTSEEVLATVTIPANTLAADGSVILVKLFGHTAANGNNKTIKVRIGGLAGTVVYSSLAVAANNQNFGMLEPLTVQRTSATTAFTFGYGGYLVNATATSGITAFGTYTDRAAAITWANANDLVITGTTPTAAGDLTLDSYLVEVAQ